MNESMVLRTVYLPVELDDALKLRAFRESTSKGDLIRAAVREYLASPSPRPDEREIAP